MSSKNPNKTPRTTFPAALTWRRPGRTLAASVLALSALLGLASSSAGQPLSLSRFDFSFSNPGARSLGFGGAFAGLADDATAAYANPAGLVQLTEPEVSLETRAWRFTPAFIAEERFLEGTNESGFSFEQKGGEEVGPSFLSFVYPMGRWSFAVYGHRLATFDQSLEWDWLVFDRPGGSAPGQPTARERTELDIISVGFSAAWRVNDRLSLGFGLLAADTRFETSSEFFLPSLGQDGGGQGGGAPFDPDRLLSSSGLQIDDTGVGFSLGLLWQVNDRISAGLAYRQGPDAEGTFRLGTGPAIEFDEGDLRFEQQATFEIPDVLALGLAYRSDDGRWTVASELSQIAYSGLISYAPIDEIDLQSPGYEDGWNARLGAELALLRSTPILAFRAGTWVEGERSDLGRGSIVHGTAGLGVAAERYQVDLAVDLSSEVDIISLSFLYRL